MVSIFACLGVYTLPVRDSVATSPRSQKELANFCLFFASFSCVLRLPVKYHEINREKLPAHRMWNSVLNVYLINLELLVASLGNALFVGDMFSFGGKTLTIARKRFIPVQLHSIHFFFLRARVFFRNFNHVREHSVHFNQGRFDGTNLL